MTPDHSPVRVTVFDYGAGNLHSLVKALETQGALVHVETDPEAAVHDTDALVLPGVGAFAPAAARLAPGREMMRDALLDGLPALGICLGMQLLFDGSDEGPGRGLGIVPGQVRRLDAARVPQIGWNNIDDSSDPLLREAELDIAYYANSYVGRPTAAGLGYVTAWSTHETDRFPAAVRRDNVIGTQFHPEKSSTRGVALIRAFLSLASSLRSMA
ncbi:imidazole glycerol phosphate synthase subunit HisH [Gemmatimonas aurantiaca T-27]|uniref:Imidazole glycerol phosphate synthase subunit HisH n=1 Tax=Gemmatimonas aurantiaca (strain DSM 14586 / JCM 11422 / NBRC 100505 / T-27) TaxID=379066 RepID=C1A4M0_GEMAT|nr:imidazole glycerol phosphate synthase subunit HisH [Gemmatimonas aurantiaca]BAH37180.1 imidazole glycerol phosphate synthase subunit HisH [Gemmatimonas aurantiaca T-27]